MPEPNQVSKKQGIIGLFLKFSVGSWFAAALSFFTTPIVTNLILVEEFGRASMFTLAYSFALQIVLLGADQSFVRKFYEKDFEDNRSSLLQSCLLPALAIGLILAFFCIAFWKNISVLLIDRKEFEICILLAATILVGILERYAVLVIRMYKKGLLFSALRIIGSLVTFLVVVFYCMYVERSMYAILYSILVSMIITAGVAIAIERKLWFKKASFTRSAIRSVLKYGIPFIPTFLVYWVFEGVDKIALRTYNNDFDQIGLFAAAFKVVAILSILQLSFSTFWSPVAYEAYEKQSNESKEVFKKTFAYVSFLLFAAGIGITAFKDIIMLFFDEAYREAGRIMPFLLFVPIMYTMSEVTVGGINFKNKTHFHLVITLIVAVANVIGAVLLVPAYGAKGAAISTGLSYILFFYCRTYLSVRLFPIDFGLKRISFSIFILVTNSFVHTFYETAIWNITLSAVFMTVLIFLYSREVKEFYNIALGKLKFA